MNEGRCALVFDRKTGSLTVLDENGLEPRHETTQLDDKGKVTFKGYALSWQHKMGEYEIEKGSQYYNAIMSAVSDAMAQKPGKADFGDDKTYPTHSLELPSGKGGKALTMTVHDMNGDGKFNAGEKISFSKDGAPDRYPEFVHSPKGLEVAYEMSAFARGLFANASGTSDEQIQRSKNYIKAKENEVKDKYPSLIKILREAGYPTAAQKEDGF